MLKQDVFDSIFNIARQKLEKYPKHAQLDPNLIAKTVDEAIAFYDEKSEFHRERLIKFITNIFTVQSSDQSIISFKSDHKDWYFNNKKENRPRWESYRDFLKFNEQYSYDGVNSIDKTSDNIMGLIEDPHRKGAWDTRGLVVGGVQSGKTSNFIGLVNKAYDAGYRCVIILSGLHNNLRKQTQERVDQGCLGYDSRSYDVKTKFIDRLPLFKIHEGKNLDREVIDTFTTADNKGDFNQSKAKGRNIVPENKIVFIIKKNKKVLEDTIKFFLKSQFSHTRGCDFKDKTFEIVSDTASSFPFIRDYPVLIIDDEVDNASVDTGDQPDDHQDEETKENYNPKTINDRIRKLLNIFEKKSYVGYTATPFANIFVNEKAYTKQCGKDIFPKDFILDLPIPDNHTGLEKLFPEDAVESGEVGDKEIEENKFCELIGDSSDDPNDMDCSTGWLPPRHDKNHIPRMEDENLRIPKSLSKAILSFILSCVIRNIRDENLEHKTMLIHVTRFKNVQEEVKKLIQLEMDDIRKSILEKNEKMFSLLKNMKEIYFNEFYTRRFNYEDRDYPDWEEIIDKKNLNPVINDVFSNIKCLNGETKPENDLDYDDYKRSENKGLCVIAIGGDKLSRGLTLKGLTISYFLRSARTPMYDTLMQMGRWFGYRKEYEDLCVIYTTKNIVNYFFHISKAISELRALFRVMSLKKPPATPMEFGLRVKDHPVMAITNRYKMRRAKTMTTCFAGDANDYRKFSLKDNSVKDNEKLFKNFLDSLGKAKKNFTAMNRNYENSYQWKNIDTNKVILLLKKFKHFPADKGDDAKIVSEYIEKMQRLGELTNFTVTLFGQGEGEKKIIFDQYEIFFNKRKVRNSDLVSTVNFGVLTREAAEGADLTSEEYVRVRQLVDQLKKEKKFKSNEHRQTIRDERSSDRGALIIYPVEYQDINNKKSFLYTLSLSFPNTKMPRDDASINYQVNNIYNENL